MFTKKVVLAVDDTTVNLIAVRDALDLYSNFIDLRLAKNSALALKALKSVKADLILLDIDMPDVNGFELMEIFKDIDYIKDVPVMFVTSSADHDSVIQATMTGAVDYIVKPFKPYLLRAKVAEALNLDLPKEFRI